MAKDKKGSKAVASAPTPSVSKPLETVKAGRVTKPIENPKAVAKEAAKKAVKEVEKESKKTKRDPTPDSSGDEDDSSESSASSDEERDQEVKTKADSKLSDTVKVAAGKTKDSDIDSDSESDSDSSGPSDSDDDVAPKKAAAPKINGAAKSGSDADDSDDASDRDDEEAPKVNGKAEATSDSGEDSDDDSDESSDSFGSESDSDDEVDVKAGAEKLGGDGAAKADAADSSDASSSDDGSDEEEVVKVEETAKKRKAEHAIDQTPKKTKVTVNGEQKDAVSNLFVGNLSWNVDEEWLTREFEEFGELSGVRVITDRDSGRSKGYGYVEFTQVDSAVQALEAMNGTMIDGRYIRVDFSLPRQPKNDGFTPQQRSFDRAQRYGDTPKEPSKTLFVGNVSFNADESMLSELFQDYGTITAVRLPTDKATEQLKGYGYVDFTTIDEAKAAFEGLQGANISGRPIRLDFASERSNNDSPSGGRWTRGAPRGRGGFSDRGGRGSFSDRGGRGGFNDRGRGRGGARGGRGNTTNRGGFGDFSGKKTSF